MPNYLSANQEQKLRSEKYILDPQAADLRSTGTVGVIPESRGRNKARVPQHPP